MTNLYGLSFFLLMFQFAVAQQSRKGVVVSILFGETTFVVAVSPQTVTFFGLLLALVLTPSHFT